MKSHFVFISHSMFSQFWNSNTQLYFKGRYFKSFYLFQASLHALHSNFYFENALLFSNWYMCVHHHCIDWYTHVLHRWQTLVGFIVLRLLVITKHVPAMLTDTQRLEHLSPCDLIAFKPFSNCASDNTADIVIIFVLGKENEYCKH